METLSLAVQRIAPGFLRISLAVVLFWIGALKFAEPEGVVGLLEASLPFLASTAFVYLLGVFEVGAAVLLVAGVGLRYVGLFVAGLFVGTLVIFVVAPAVSYGEAGFPRLSLAGEFLLKDLVLMAAALSVAAGAAVRPGSAA